ncbi:Crp/Fnr family transcriptional regulator [Thiolapillus brandeum]|uniref:Transcriptional regulator, Crp/Fnr family n=1 Tax=Thiolapillus brandeum TaxID=1076588 RepID=A0A7U6JHF1_9GAMM|nr:Crp/Fnr family transcriptional regulator [Thiolapillus brandeum]BAO43628.1 transcriptional regulator, Crp/Fnr family [Thiolapillus brandeum]
MDAYTIANVLNRMPVFEGLDPEMLYMLSMGAKELVVDKGQRVFQKGDHARGFYFVIEGKFKLAFTSSRGTEKVVEIVHQGQSFGESVILADSVWPYYSQALQDSRLLYVSSSAFLDVVSADRKAADMLLRSMARRLSQLFSDMEAFCLLTSKERVVGYLLREIEQKRQRGDDDMTVDLPDTKANTASLLNLTPETFSRVIHTLEREQIISVSRRKVVVLDLPQLQKGGGC